MKLRLGVAVLAASLACTSAQAVTFTALYAFGDSLSDAGNLTIYAAANPGLGITPLPSPPYYPGHASNGPTWVEDLSVKLGLGTLTPSLAGGNDYAFAGAQSGSPLINQANPAQIDLPFQVAAFAGASHSTPVSSALFTLDIGANDILNGIKALATSQITLSQFGTVVGEAVSNALTAIGALCADGARNLLFYDVPKLSLTPQLNMDPASIKTLADLAAQTFNADVLAGVAALDLTGLKVYNLDTYDLLNAIVSDPSVYGFTNATQACVSILACVGGTLDQQNDYLFWDGVHPTAAGHMLTADFALNAVPEPSTWAMMLFGFAGLAFAGYLRARRARAA
jgi:outer membrane lipase/esterase